MNREQPRVAKASGGIWHAMEPTKAPRFVRKLNYCGTPDWLETLGDVAYLPIWWSFALFLPKYCVVHRRRLVGFPRDPMGTSSRVLIRY